VDQSVLGDRYRVEARLGAGGMAEVFRGVDPVLNRDVAIKVLLPQFARDAGFVARFRREAQAAARLNHPAIVGVFDTGADGDTQYIVMEFVEGRTLADTLARGRRPTPIQSVELAERIAEALAVAHRAGIVHRDIKPANVMVTREGRVKVMDFGIARIQTVETAPQTSSVLGTPTYLSPEQAQGQPVDARSDLYSLGVVLYELLAGRPPFTGDSPVAIAYKQVNEPPVPPSQLNPDVPPRLDAVVMKALSKNPANRYQTAEDMIADLERVRKGQEVEATPLMPAAEATMVIARPQATQVLPPPEEPQGSGRKVWLGVLIGILAVAILGGAGYLLATSLSGDNQTEAFALPDLRGQQFDQAKADLEGRGLVVTRKDKASTKPEGQVLDQDPAPQTQVRTGDTVELTVAVPRPPVVVPDLTGMTLDEAATALAQLNLTLGAKTPEANDTVPDGQIFQQSVPAGTEVDRGTLIDVTYSSGPGTVTIGDYTCRTFGAVKNELGKLGLDAVLGGTAPPLSQCPNPNFIAAQDPAAGTDVAVGGTVTLFTGEEPSPSTTGSPSP
jgi:beta-lactam-binding protein with PASTA domain/predicted Ser/Thr protein kinase